MLNIKKIITSSSNVLGVAKETRRYDLPLNKGSGNTFLKTLIALMTFLAMLGLASTFALSEMKDRWSSGLENKASIEIPAEDTNGMILPQDKLDELTNKVYSFLQTHPAVETIHIMEKQEIIDLVEPWLGSDLAFDNIPLPGILTVGFKNDIIFDVRGLEEKLKQIAPQAKLDTHKSWLNDVLRFTGALNFAALLITAIIGITTIVAVAGAIQSRMAVYNEELELLHLMGASDNYISKQLQRYMMLLTLQGSAIGAFIGGIILLTIGFLAGEMDVSLLPDFSLSPAQLIILIVLPIIISVLGMLTARQTVLRVLAKMP